MITAFHRGAVVNLGACMRFAMVVATCLAVSGCAATQSALDQIGTATLGAEDPVADSRWRVSESYNYKTLRGYAWNGTVYADEGQLNRTIDDAVTKDMAALGAHKKVAAALKVLRPNANTVGGGADMANLRLAEARIEALRNSAVFQSLRVENAAPGRFVTKGKDYALQFDRRGWLLRDGEDRQVAVGNGKTLASFVDKVLEAVDILDADRDRLRVFSPASGPNGGEMVTYRDRTYADLVSLVDAFDRDNAQMAGHVVPATKPLGGRALLVLPRRGPDRMLLLAGEKPGLISSARKSYRLALDKRFARYLQAGKIFNDITLVFADELGAVPLEYDWILWRLPNDWGWSGSSRDHDFGMLNLSAQPGGFADALVQALTLPPDVELDDLSPPPPLRNTMEPQYFMR